VTPLQWWVLVVLGALGAGVQLALASDLRGIEPDAFIAIPAAKLGAQVLGVDIAANLVAAGNRRAAQAGFRMAPALDGLIKHHPRTTFRALYSDQQIRQMQSIAMARYQRSWGPYPRSPVLERTRGTIATPVEGRHNKGAAK